MNINLPVTFEAGSWSALGPRIQETDCAASGTGAPHLWAPGPGQTPPLRAKRPGGWGAKPYSLSTSDRTVSTPPYWQKWCRILAKVKLYVWQPGARTKIMLMWNCPSSSLVQRSLKCLRSIAWERSSQGYKLRLTTFLNELNPAECYPLQMLSRTLYNVIIQLTLVS